MPGALNVGVHILELKASLDGNIAGLQRFNVLHHLPEALQTGGSVAGMDECYMVRPRARDNSSLACLSNCVILLILTTCY